MKKVIYILLGLLFGVNAIVLAGNRNVTCQITFKASDGTLVYPGSAEAPFSEMDIEWEMRHMDRIPVCVAKPGEAGINSSFTNNGRAITLKLDLNVFKKCGDHQPGDNIMIVMTIKKVGHPLNNVTAECAFTVKDLGAFSLLGANGIVFEAPAKPQISVDDITICAGVTGGRLMATIDPPAEAGYTIDWRTSTWGAASDLGNATGDNIEVIGNITATSSYHAILKNAGGVALDTADFIITVNQNPDATAGLAVGGKTDICKGDKVNLISGPNGAATYKWTGGAGNVQNPTDVVVSATGATKFTVTVTDAKGCNDTASVTVTAHSVTLNQTTPISIANGASTPLVANPTYAPNGKQGAEADIVYLWSPGDKLQGGTTNTKTVNTINLTADQDYTIKVTDKYGCASPVTTVKVLVTGSALAVNPVNTEGCNGTEFALDAKVSGGTQPYTITWSNLGGLVLDNVNAAKPKVKNTTPAGTYTDVTVTVTDANNGTPIVKKITVTVGVAPKLSDIKATDLTSTVNVSTLSVTVVPAAPASICTWTPAASINGANVGTSVTTNALTDPIPEFTVTATNADGKCPATSKVTPVRLGDALSATITAPDEICADAANFSVGVTPKGGSGIYTYAWSAPGVVFDDPTAKNPTVTNGATLAGSIVFSVDVSDGNETITKTKTVKVSGVIAATSSTTCTSATKFDGIVVITGGVAPYTIYSNAAGTVPVTGVTWNGNTGTISNLTSGTTYNYFAKDSKGCNVAAIPAMSADCACGAELTLSIPAEIPCAEPGAEVNITITARGGTSYSFRLTKPDGSPIMTVTDEVGPWNFAVKYDVHPAGQYQAKGFVAKTNANPAGCDGNVQGTPNVQFNTMPVFDAQGDITNACAGDILQLRTLGNPSNNTTFEWTGTGIEPNGRLTAVVGTNTYTVTGTNRFGCSATDVVDVTVHPRPDVNIQEGNQAVCLGETVTLTATGATNYLWSPANVVNGVAFTPTTTGKYSATGTNDEGCSDTASVMVVVNNPPVITEQSGDRTIAIGRDVWFSVTAVGQNLSYVWEQESNGAWMQLADANGSIPKISGATTNRITFTGVPESWNGSKFRCVVTGDCGSDMAEFNLSVKECFEIQDVILEMGEGIRPDEIPGDAIDGWYCIGTKIALNASIILEPGEVVQNPRYKWSIDGLRVTYTDSSVLSWVPQYWEDDIVVKVSAYCDGACDTIASKWIRLKARPFEDIKLGIRTSIDPERSFCPGQVIDFSVYGKGLGEHPKYQWYNDIFDKGVSEVLTMTMTETDTWIKVIVTPSSEVCASESSYTDTVHLSVKPDAKPKLHIENSINDTVACRGDQISLIAVYEGAGMNPMITWQRDVWNLGTGQFASIILDGKEKDVWIKCSLYPGNNVCYAGDTLVDYMKIKILEDVGTVAITSDLEEGKRPGDEITFKATTENIIGDNYYEWFVNAMLTNEPTDTYISSILHQGDKVVCAVSGSRICQTRVFSNEIVVDFNRASRDTLVEIHKGEIVKNLNMSKIGDENSTFMLQELPKWGTAVMTYDGVFTYYPARDFVGSDYVKYIVRDRYDKDKFEEGYIYIRVLSNERYFIPNIITPNGDGQNDTWVLNFLQDYPNHLITVYNRSGRVVFQTKNYQNDWNGQGLSPSGYVAHINLPNGIYTYVIDLGNKELIKSWIEIRSDIYRKGNR